MKVYVNGLRQKGYLAYEYNPFHNYQTEEDLYEINTDIGTVLVPRGKAVNKINGNILSFKNGLWVDSHNNIISGTSLREIDCVNDKLYATAGSIIDLDTDKLNFDLEHPVDILVLPSYDGSVNLILNDGKNIPRLINSRFSPREKNTFEIVDRIGENDTNIYNSETFDKDTALYFLYESDPTIEFKGYSKGILPVGLYCFYFTYCDADDNESDYIGETGLIPVFIGTDKDAYSIDGGIKNQETTKGIRLTLSNLDKSYNYLKVYYVRYFADYLLNRVYEGKKIYKKYAINSATLHLQISGLEEAEDIDPNILNLNRFNPKSVTTSALCKNMLFQGHIVKNADNYKELLDCALRIVPEIFPVGDFYSLNREYSSSNSKYGYYEALKMYNNVGYHNDEFYRFGVVFIYLNGTLSNVYNVLGRDLTGTNTPKCSIELFNEKDSIFIERKYIPITDEGWISNSYFNNIGENLNSKGVCKINYDELYNSKSNEATILGIKFNVPSDIMTYLKEDLGIRGLFFVRLKRIPLSLGLCYLLPIDEQLEGPAIELEEDGLKHLYTEAFVSLEDQLVINDYDRRLYKYKGNLSRSKKAYAGICPDFLLNLPYYNQIFNGSKFRLKRITQGAKLKKNGRFYKESDDLNYTRGFIPQLVTINTVTEDVRTVAIKNNVYRLDIGRGEEVFRFQYAEIDTGSQDVGKKNTLDIVNKATNIVRGTFSPYLAIYSEKTLETSEMYEIYLDTSNTIVQDYKLRMDSLEPFYAISGRYNFNNLEPITKDSNVIGGSLTCWRGDCFINNFTYRLNRNFNDPSLPNNDKIIDSETWKKYYKIEKPEDWTKISASDINAVQMGSWITIKVRSSINYALRSQDHSYVSEEALMGAPRSFYPRSMLMWRGENKMPDSYLYNDAYRATLGYKCYFTLNDPNYIKNTFSNRIQYSAIAIQDSFKNNYRDSLSTYFRDYSLEYGSITKLVGFEGYLLVVFEHGIGIAVVNERVLAGQGEGEPVFINTKNVLPEELTVVSDTYGSQWMDSIVKSELGYVYGVDTIAKKIWRVKGLEIEILSDFKVGSFLVDNITLGERELYPVVGLRDVKTHYNNNKKDVLFTFYDDTYKDEEKVWNLCYNELIGEFITLYSWVPSFSENIDTLFFTFNRDTSKWIALLSKHSYSSNKTGLLVDNPILNSDNNYTFELSYADDKQIFQTILNEDDTTNLITNYIDSTKPEVNGVTYDFVIEKDHWGNWKHINKILNGKYQISLNGINRLSKLNPVILLEITPVVIWLKTPIRKSTQIVALTTKEILENPCLTREELEAPSLTTDFYLHGHSGIFNFKETLYPTKWYNEVHPFELEFVVNEQVALLKIFENLIIISNKAEPDSFHFEIEGDNYVFSSDKRAMYCRLEITKEAFLNSGSDILYDRDYLKIIGDEQNRSELYYRYKGTEYELQYSKLDRVYPIEKEGLVQQVKSTIFPLYYERIDTYNRIYDIYTQMNLNSVTYDYKNLSGSEIKWNKRTNLFNIVTHIKNSPIDLVGRLRGNSRYKEGKWHIQIPSIIFNQKNEEPWSQYKSNGSVNQIVPPIVLNSIIPGDIDEVIVSSVPDIYENLYIDTSDWTARKEARIRDKWMKVRIRYSGRNLVTIYGIITLFNISTS